MCVLIVDSENATHVDNTMGYRESELNVRNGKNDVVYKAEENFFTFG